MFIWAFVSKTSSSVFHYVLLWTEPHETLCYISVFSGFTQKETLKCLSMSVSCNCWLSVQSSRIHTVRLHFDCWPFSAKTCHFLEFLCCLAPSSWSLWNSLPFFLELVMLEIYAQSKKKNVGVFLTIGSLFKCTIIIWCISSFLSGQLSMRARLPYWIWDIGDQSKHSSVTQCDCDGVYLRLNLLNFKRKL